MKVLSIVPTVRNLSVQSLIVSNIHTSPNSWTRKFMNLVAKIVALSPVKVKAHPCSVRFCKRFVARCETGNADDLTQTRKVFGE